MSPFPHVRREQVPITDPRWLASTQPDPEPEVDERRGLDGNGAMHAADLPRTAHTWGYCSPPSEFGATDDLDEETPVKREKCLKVDPEGDYVMPGRCRKPLGHEPPCDWHASHGALLGDVRRAELRDTPSDALPRRVPGEALRTAVEFQQAMDDFQMEPSAENLAATREVIETWPA